MELKEYVSNINDVWWHLAKDEMLAQLAEEAAELAQAALKLRRILYGMNPARISKETAVQNLIEEYSDVKLCWDVFTIDEHGWDDKTMPIMMQKAKRWRDGLRGCADERDDSGLTV